MELTAIQNKIYELRGQKIVFDFDLAAMYETETRTLKQAVKRNITRFPEDFMFQLTKKEIENLVSQNVIPSKQKLGGALPFAFTEQGVAMLSSILNSERAIQVNIIIIRTFVLVRQYALNYKELAAKLSALEKKYNKNFKIVFEVLNKLIEEKQNQLDFEQRERIGFKK
ncbi:MAG TPA: ORF6N domain-containing protein [Parafilimonas sp.]|nr:ORF6N domain-containing protein [Parafilimonas sp.]